MRLKENGKLHQLKTRWWKERSGGRCMVSNQIILLFLPLFPYVNCFLIHLFIYYLFFSFNQLYFQFIYLFFLFVLIYIWWKRQIKETKQVSTSREDKHEMVKKGNKKKDQEKRDLCVHGLGHRTDMDRCVQSLLLNCLNRLFIDLYWTETRIRKHRKWVLKKNETES